jgi:hypothetical protein
MDGDKPYIGDKRYFWVFLRKFKKKKGDDKGKSDDPTSKILEALTGGRIGESLGGLKGQLGGLTSGFTGQLGGITSQRGGATSGITSQIGGITGQLGTLSSGLTGQIGGISSTLSSGMSGINSPSHSWCNHRRPTPTHREHAETESSGFGTRMGMGKPNAEVGLQGRTHQFGESDSQTR